MTTPVILLGTEFMFKEELGSRLRGVGYTVHPYDNLTDLQRRLTNEKYNAQLVIIDLSHSESGGFEAVKIIKDHDIPIIAIGSHKLTDTLQQARDLAVDKVIVNSQASKQIEKYVQDILER